ncbi:MAG: peroxiredoxin family protein [Bacteroidia bacterium]
MKRFGSKFLVSVTLDVAAIALLLAHLPLYAAIASAVAFFPNTLEIKQYASVWQFGNFYVHTLLLGFCIDLLTAPGTHCFTLSMFCMQLMGLTRLQLFDKVHTNQLPWLEIFGTGLTYGLYVFANLQHPSDWRGWAIPIGPMLLMLWIGGNVTRQSIKDRNPRVSAKKEPTELGKKAPQFSLDDIEGKNVSLSDFQDKNHVLLIFVRGDWCPSCHIMIRAYEKSRERFAEKNVIPIGISPDSSEVNKAMMERLGWKNMLLSDPLQEIAGKYGILFTDNNPETKYQQGVALPASFLVDKNGVLRYMSRSDRAGEFLSPSLIFPIVDDLN